MTQLFASLPDLSLNTLQGVGLSGPALTNPVELAMRLGFGSVAVWGLQSAGIDQQIEGFLAQYLPPQVAMAVSTTAVCGAGDILGGELRRITGY